MPIWLRDYVVYHGLDVSLLSNDSAIAFDQALFELVRQSAPFDPDLLDNIDELVVDDEPEEETVAPRPPLGRGKQSALQLPADIELEEALLFAADALSTYRIRLSRLYKDYHDDLRHVFCSVYVRLLAYYRRNRSNGLVETMFGEQMRMTYTCLNLHHTHQRTSSSTLSIGINAAGGPGAASVSTELAGKAPCLPRLCVRWTADSATR